jgi:hypothetical protein
MAPPPIAIINSEDPVFVNLPNPSIANGQIDGQINELANPNNEIKTTDNTPDVNNAITANEIPAMAESFNAFSCLMKRGMQIIPLT